MSVAHGSLVPAGSPSHLFPTLQCLESSLPRSVLFSLRASKNLSLPLWKLPALSVPERSGGQALAGTDYLGQCPLSYQGADWVNSPRAVRGFDELQAFPPHSSSLTIHYDGCSCQSL